MQDKTGCGNGCGNERQCRSCGNERHCKENKSKEIMEYFDSVGVKNHGSTAHEQWQNGLAEAAINLSMRLAHTVLIVLRSTS